MESILPYIAMKDVSFSYPKGGFLIKNISVEFYKNEFTAVVGPNGSGKTTLGKLVAGIFKPGSGDVYIDGKNTKDMSLGEIGGRIGYLFQNPDRQIFTSSVYDEIAFVLELKGIEKDEVKERVYEMLGLFNLSHLEKSIPFKLSRGEKQRLALASMLVNNPGFLILDEPTTGLDMERRAMLSDVIEKLMGNGIGIIAISHDESFIEKHAARVVRIQGGEIADDTKREA